MIPLQQISAFVEESNRIEGIHGIPTGEEVLATKNFLALRKLTIDAVKGLVAVYEPSAELRDRRGLDVRVGDYIAPLGGPSIRGNLYLILSNANFGTHPYTTHQSYEALHPFTDGNGRSGRAIWAWQMINQRGEDLTLGFLHRYYYQSLENGCRI